MREGLIVAERYRVHRLLGRGGLGEVWEATDPAFPRQVAIKFVTGAARYPQAATRFAREAPVLASLRHPGIVTVFDTGFIPGEYGGQMPYLVMELLTGTTWEHARVTSVTRTGARIADALAHAHAKKIAHRDVKPANIMILSDGTPVLLDFGIARDDNALSLTVTATGQGFGTPGYMAPEQWAGARGTDAVDIYALGLILQEKFTGRRDPADIDPARSPLPTGVCELLRRMTARTADDRPTATECAARLRALVPSSETRRPRQQQKPSAPPQSGPGWRMAEYLGLVE